MQKRLLGFESSFGIPLLLCGVAALAVGCSPSAAPVFDVSVEVQSLPERHQGNIADALQKLFGTPDFPQSMIPDESAVSDDEEAPLPLVAAVDAARLRHGAQVYQARCSGCHGITGNGLARLRTICGPSHVTIGGVSLSSHRRRTESNPFVRTWCV